MEINDLKFMFLDQLAMVVCEIDDNKSMGFQFTTQHIIRAALIIEKMKANDCETGSLEDIFLNFRPMHFQSDRLPILIDLAHEEICRLLGTDAVRVYASD